MKRLLPLLLIALLVVFIFPASSQADELEETTRALNQKQAELQKAKDALAAARAKEQVLAGGLNPLQATLDTAIAEVEVKQAEVNEVLADLDRQEAALKKQKDLRDVRLRELYKKMYSDKGNQVVSLLDSENLVSFARLSAYQQRVLGEEERLIIDLNKSVAEIAEKRAGLQKELDKLAEEKRLAQQQVDNLQYEIYLARRQQWGASSSARALEGQIKGLTAKQQKLAAQKRAANEVKVIAGGETATPLPNPTFSQAYAFVSYGYYHRVGMNQWGARGRALAGQNYQQILKTYFNNVAIEKKGNLGTINVVGHGSMSFEGQYLRGISEMSRSWGSLGGGKGIEALKAQAVAARTYAYKWVKDGRGAICTTQTCQVYNPSLANDTNKNGWDYPYNQLWYRAVKETEGMIITQNGNPIDAWYSSTAGGYTQRSDQAWGGVRSWTKVTRDYTGSWPGGAYDKESPWFYKAWGSRGGGFNPWITKDEMADLLNAAILLQKTGATSGSDFDILRSDFGGSTPAQLRSALSKRGVTPVSSISRVVTHEVPSLGEARLDVQTNSGAYSFTGPQMQRIINARAPGSIELTSTLFNVEVR